jgi:2-C-methyl-D-erythritol 4-phosphate cytidylyltransferase / 2-C-methyl-D-erythritol 2,4-cyclodiphosphate synthase
VTPDRRAAVADAIVVAAGTSARMGGVDKMLVPLMDRPLLAWTLDRIAASAVIVRIVVVASRANIDPVAAASWLPSKVTQVVVGGDRRQASVAAGFEALRMPSRRHSTDDRLDRVVLVHDGARPFISEALIESVASAAAVHGAAIPGLPISETVKRLDGDRVASTIDRSRLVTAQTPQGVQGRLLASAYERFPPDGPETFTDEAALLEACSIPVHVIDGDPGNVKVTLPADLARAEAALGGGSGGTRTGIGHDSHPFGPGAPLVLGGVTIESAPRLHGHSDGDVALHAVCDALLGAAGLGDLGRLFPAGPATPEGIAGSELLREVLRRVDDAGWRPASVDLTIVAARPKLGSRLDTIRETLSAALRLETARVNVKASTGNLDGMEGAGRGISAIAIAVVESAG